MRVLKDTQQVVYCITPLSIYAIGNKPTKYCAWQLYLSTQSWATFRATPSLTYLRKAFKCLSSDAYSSTSFRALSLSLPLWPILFVSRLVSAFFCRFPLIVLCLSPTLQIAKIQLIIWNKSFVVFVPRSERDTWLKAYTN